MRPHLHYAYELVRHSQWNSAQVVDILTEADEAFQLLLIATFYHRKVVRPDAEQKIHDFIRRPGNLDSTFRKST